jgi:thioesterase domain-containing protein/acyl carrier protein
VTRLIINTDYVRLKPVDVVAQVSNASFDAVTWEIWGALLNGARLVGISTPVLLSPKTFAAEIRAKKISSMFLTTALFNQMAREFPSAFQTVEHLLFGGEAAEPGCVRAVLRHAPPRRLLNVYGPTETTTFASWHKVGHVAEDARTIPIGRPIQNCQMYVLDPHLEPVPVRVKGELYVAGDGLSRGYLHHPELTAEKFIPNPFSLQPGSRLYRTGDLAGYRGDGRIEFLGRVDGQVKLRGFRIEPGEIEEALRQHPGVQEAIVLAREDSPGENRLVAYAISLQKPGPTTQELRKFLQSKLPDYMVPSAFVFLDRFPITSNGKVNRQALPRDDHDLDRLQPEKGCEQPENELELQLVNIWKGILRVPAVRITDNFFELGGHSLMAVRLVAAIEKVVGRTIPLAALFQAPTVERMAQLLRKEGPSAPWSLLVPIQVSGSRPPFFFLHGTLELAKYMDHDQPFYLLQPHGIDGKALPPTIEVMAAEYISEIRRVQPVGPYFLGGYSFGGLVAFEIAQQLRQAGLEVALLVLLDPTDPSHGKKRRPSAHVSVPSLRTFTLIRSSLDLQLRNLARLEFRQWLAYLAGGIKWRAVPWVTPITKRIKRIICRYYLSHKGRVPPALRDFYWVQGDRQVARGYKPDVYPGSALLIISRDRHADTVNTWNTLITGGLEIEWVTGDHLQIIREPQVQAVVARFNRYLCQAQGVAEKP